MCAHWYATDAASEPNHGAAHLRDADQAVPDEYVPRALRHYRHHDLSSTVLFCIFKDVKRRDAIRRTLSGARLCGMDKVA